MRRKFGVAFCWRTERAEKTEDERERDEYLTFVIVGGGPTGVELVGAIPFIAKKALHSEFRRIATRRTRVILVEAGPRILPSFPEDLAQHAARDLADLGVEVRVNSMVTGVDAEGVTVGTEKIRARTAFWAAGNRAIAARKITGRSARQAGRVKVNEDLSVPVIPRFSRSAIWRRSRKTGGWCLGYVPPLTRRVRSLRSRSFATRGISRGRNSTTSTKAISRRSADRAQSRTSVEWKFTGRLAWFLWLFVHIIVSRRISQHDRGVHRVGVLVIHVPGGASG